MVSVGMLLWFLTPLLEVTAGQWCAEMGWDAFLSDNYFYVHFLSHRLSLALQLVNMSTVRMNKVALRQAGLL